ncbi:hypothetical protein SAPIO_CDS0473 [Scedosporium apiospermum]|uniref:Uncharacterized protein n=1 Tax=Pseudallescheria apiosperma TaxID=563466 RepID=A0A084GH32_PSEDA|nr:uncharacterized protein SAPIO_CDS0473 [Scedosporium apiospermum]KEZ46644.1 hypothetical protein SAPIO_CDS0473 [Scedosporium apiospermum]
MCHGQPRIHPCSHTSVTWHYCPSASQDPDTGYETPCSSTTFAPSQQTTANCPLQNCQFKDMEGSWTCCACKQGPNTQGWCTMPTARLKRNPETFEVEAFETTCDHGCCKNCTHFSMSNPPTPDMAYGGVRKGGSSRATGHDSLASAHPESSSGASSDLSSRFKIDLDYTTVGKDASAGEKSQKSGRH